MFVGCSVHFTIVTEPDSDQEDDDSVTCVDIGVARISIPEILKNGRDILGEEIPGIIVSFC